MGLDFSHGNARWSYGGFHRFRERLAMALDINLMTMQGFVPGGHPWPGKDVIEAFLNHSDCDDILTVEQCQEIAPRLRELVEPWPENDYDRVMALRLVAGMEEAIGFKEPLEFM